MKAAPTVPFSQLLNSSAHSNQVFYASSNLYYTTRSPLDLDVCDVTEEPTKPLRLRKLLAHCYFIISRQIAENALAAIDVFEG